MLPGQDIIILNEEREGEEGKNQKKVPFYGSARQVMNFSTVKICFLSSCQVVEVRFGCHSQKEILLMPATFNHISQKTAGHCQFVLCQPLSLQRSVSSLGFQHSVAEKFHPLKIGSADSLCGNITARALQSVLPRKCTTITWNFKKAFEKIFTKPLKCTVHC